MKITRKEKRKSKITITKSIEEKLDKSDDSDKRKSPFLPKEKSSVEKEIKNLINNDDFFSETAIINNSEQKNNKNEKTIKEKVKKDKKSNLSDFILLIITFIGFIAFIGFLWKILG